MRTISGMEVEYRIKYFSISSPHLVYDEEWRDTLAEAMACAETYGGRSVVEEATRTYRVIKKTQPIANALTVAAKAERLFGKKQIRAVHQSMVMSATTGWKM